MLRVYLQTAAPLAFLSGLFGSPPQNFHNSEEVELDIVRSEEDIAIVVQSLSAGYRYNTLDTATNKSFKPPIFKEAFPINAFDLLKRSAGNDPFMNPDFRAALIERIFNGAQKIEAKIRRSIEMQASQILQTGVVTLTDINGTALYSIDYKPKTSHFPTAGTVWGQTGATPAADIDSLAEQVRTDGLADPDELYFGVDAFEEFIKDTDIQNRLDIRRLEGSRVVSMEKRGNGGTYRGSVEIGNYKYDMWTYGGRYKDPATGTATQYLSPEKVVVRASSGRLDATFGAIPNIASLLGVQRPVSLTELPGRMQNGAGSMDIWLNTWLSLDGEQFFAGLGSRPLLIPTAIDTYGCLDTGL